jgi:hypothetical protein
MDPADVCVDDENRFDEGVAMRRRRTDFPPAREWPVSRWGIPIPNDTGAEFRIWISEQKRLLHENQLCL